MMPYIVLLFIIFFICYIGESIKRVKLSSYIIIFLLALFSSVRHINVGTDTFMYEIIFNSFSSNIKESVYYDSMEKGYVFLNWVVQSLGLSFSFLLFFVSFIYLTGFNLLNKKIKYFIDYSLSISWIFFILFGWYLFVFNGIRQALALSMCWVSLSLIITNKKLLSLIAMVLAILFHTSSIIFFIVLLIFKLNNKYSKVIAFIFSLIILFFVNYLILFAGDHNERYSAYSEFKAEGSGLGTLIFLTLNFFILILFKFYYKIKDNFFDKLLIILYMGVIVVASSYINNFSGSGIMRLTKYFDWSLIFCWSYLVRYLNANIRVFFVFLILSIFMIYFFLSVYSYGEVYPYIFNWEKV